MTILEDDADDAPDPPPPHEPHDKMREIMEYMIKWTRNVVYAHVECGQHLLDPDTPDGSIHERVDLENLSLVAYNTMHADHTSHTLPCWAPRWIHWDIFRADFRWGRWVEVDPETGIVKHAPTHQFGGKEMRVNFTNHITDGDIKIIMPDSRTHMLRRRKNQAPANMSSYGLETLGFLNRTLGMWDPNPTTCEYCRLDWDDDHNLELHADGEGEGEEVHTTRLQRCIWCMTSYHRNCAADALAERASGSLMGDWATMISDDDAEKNEHINMNKDDDRFTICLKMELQELSDLL